MLAPLPTFQQNCVGIKVEINVWIYVWMTKKKRVEKDLIPLPRSNKPKVSVTLGWSTFIDKIIRKSESQSSVGIQIVSTRNATVTLQAVGSPSAADAEIHIKTKGS